MVRREQYRKTHKVTPCPDQREIFYLWHLLAINPLHAWIYNQQPSCKGFKHRIPAAAQRCPLPPQGAGRSRILIFYFIASKKELLSLQYPSRRHFGTDQVGPPVFTHLCSGMNSCLMGKTFLFLQNPFGSGSLPVLHTSPAGGSCPPGCWTVPAGKASPPPPRLVTA